MHGAQITPSIETKINNKARNIDQTIVIENVVFVFVSEKLIQQSKCCISDLLSDSEQGGRYASSYLDH